MKVFLYFAYSCWGLSIFFAGMALGMWIRGKQNDLEK